ncbi:hypothetical protein ACW9UR_20400 [Halovulum sp. GXIMD14794]
MSTYSDYLFAGIIGVALFTIVGTAIWSGRPDDPTDIVPASNSTQIEETVAESR